MKISIDLGNGYVKAMNEKGEKLHFPTVLKENHEPNIMKSKSPYSIKIDGVDFFLGKLAIIKKGIRSWSSSKSIHEETEKYVALCCHLLTKTKKAEIELCLGLPYSYFLSFNFGNDLAKSIKDRVFETVMDGESKNLIIKEVSVYPQGVGAYFSNLYDISGKPNPNAEKYIKSICIDMGYRTVDVVSFDTLDGSFELIYENSFSLEEHGMFRAMNEISQKASMKFEISPNDVEFAIEYNHSVFESMYEDIDLKEMEQSAYENLAKEISQRINTKLSADLKKYKYLFLTGGGAERIYPYMKKYYENLQLQEDFVFCNAKGYLVLENTKKLG